MLGTRFKIIRVIKERGEKIKKYGKLLITNRGPTQCRVYFISYSMIMKVRCIVVSLLVLVRI
jgi:hypothetical protein